MPSWLPVILHFLTLIGIFAILVALFRKSLQTDDSPLAVNKTDEGHCGLNLR